eukprot:CAMPEP_0115042476 /NCGR_PEP_ID=MMETSP0216-20121206/46286_1 /TAXON_ID=223996 /ORGANISM="Protocruzia adherens, Strain Boccale" /LENGTH=413 /DNA_ID=CAMNT_0002424593 /DNA_START=157 /DNA_END=1399 /DNA_ORIENTATION=-
METQPGQATPLPGSMEDDFYDAVNFLYIKDGRTIDQEKIGPQMARSNKIKPTSILGNPGAFLKMHDEANRLQTPDNKSNISKDAAGSDTSRPQSSESFTKLGLKRKTVSPDRRFLNQKFASTFLLKTAQTKNFKIEATLRALKERQDEIEEGKRREERLTELRSSRASNRGVVIEVDGITFIPASNRGVVIRETREERVLRRFEQESDRFTRYCQRVSQQLSREPNSLVANQAFDFRKRLEDIELLESIKPQEERMGSRGWYFNLRNSLDSPRNHRNMMVDPLIDSRGPGKWIHSGVSPVSPERLVTVRQNGRPSTNHRSLRDNLMFQARCKSEQKKVRDIRAKFDPDQDGDLEVVGKSKYHSEMQHVTSLDPSQFVLLPVDGQRKRSEDGTMEGPTPREEVFAIHYDATHPY